MTKLLGEHIEIFMKMQESEDLKKIVGEVAEIISNSLRNGGRLLLCGNGGSASDAQHIAAEFVGRFQKERRAYDAEALTVNTSTLTAVGNDYGYDSIFFRQVEAKGREGDILIGISTSGKSSNVVAALKEAKVKKMITVMMTGDFENQSLDEICDYQIKVPSQVTPRIQEGHIFIGHALAEIVEEKLV